MSRTQLASRRGTRSVLLVAACLLLGASVTMAAQATAGEPVLRVSLQYVAGRYPVDNIEIFGHDSIRVSIEDASRTVDAVRADTWMFGPPVTAAEADGCPPQKVLGRRIARELWRQRGHALGVEQIIVRVHGRDGRDRMSYVDMGYGRPELERPWAGDRPGESK